MKTIQIKTENYVPVQDSVKQKLIEKILEKLEDLDISELCEDLGLDIHQVVDDAVVSKLNKMSIDQLLEKI